MPTPYAIDHYENFPVASILLPRRLRYPVSVIYTFARRADDFADEGDWPAAVRLARLAEFSQELDRIAEGTAPQTRLFQDLAAVVSRHALPLAPFYDLLDAFAQDVRKNRYAHFGEVMDYCRRSANPIGRLLLHLYGEASPRNLAYSDAICSSLQIINFLQDIAVDMRKNRIYLPQDELARYALSETDLARGRPGPAWKPFIHQQIERARRLLQAGAPLGQALHGRVGLEMRLIIMGGEAILRKLHRSDGNIFAQRPTLSAPDWLYMTYRAALAR
ncbi:MAG: squalene synthase HpnC [Betaproteobacteria bacterium]|nr:squalene synthase HpnC [Betaproteobacteria bacterium]